LEEDVKESKNEKPWGRYIGTTTPVRLPDECPVCGEFRFGGWRVLHGEAECVCGAVFQLKPTAEGDWEDVPRCKVKDEWIELLRKCYEKHGSIDEETVLEFAENNPTLDPREGEDR